MSDLKSMIAKSLDSYTKEVAQAARDEKQAKIDKELRIKEENERIAKDHQRELESILRQKIENIHILPTAAVALKRMLQEELEPMRYTLYAKVPTFIALNRKRDVKSLANDRNFVLDWWNMVTFLLVAREEHDKEELNLEAVSYQVATLMPHIGQTIAAKLSDSDFDTVDAAKKFLYKKYHV